ncbi:ribosomal protein L18e/L15 superfamily protein [Actinidia rufa]|uniref:Ribosomal protein L18e/L15 superfamily protein n=1 Tax=Actinidia rufa TaxID=165716 RepID=A0A7J0FKI8_9ERIC|nr:ribosomal protein L18e/L15 superfamily protein [Actinidia rufa]
MTRNPSFDNETQPWTVTELLSSWSVTTHGITADHSPSSSSWPVTIAVSLRFLHVRSGILAAWVFKLHIWVFKLQIPGMVLIEEDPVVVHPSNVSTASRVLPVLADAAVAGFHMAPLLPVLPEP